jgi:glycosyltransferase involved in cell wall biosynthesis
MKVLHISSYNSGGAANAAIRLHQGLLEIGIDSTFLFLNTSNRPISKSEQFELSGDTTIVKKLKKKALLLFQLFWPHKRSDRILKRRPKGFESFSFPSSEYDITKHPLYQQADIINLHWTAEFMDYSSFFEKNTKKVVWTLHDMNPFTGGCHYSAACNQFMSGCAKCPQLHVKDNKVAIQAFERKRKAINNLHNLSIVAPSKWLLDESKKSLLFNRLPHYKIPYGLNKKIFKPVNKKYSRELLNLPSEKKIILFVAASLKNKRKGFDYLIKAVSAIKDRDDVLLCSVGSASKEFDEFPNLVQLGIINDDHLLAAVYSAADVFVIPSIEDNLPNTVLESLMCGIPVIGFPVGGIKEVIINEKNGFITSAISEESLSEAIKTFLNFRELDRAAIRENSVANYDLPVQAEAYLDLYNNLL